jgi:hypothetical protein
MGSLFCAPSDLTRRGILDAIRRRHTYGAMDNIILYVPVVYK